MVVGGPHKLRPESETVIACFGSGDLPNGSLITIADLEKASQASRVIVAATLKWHLADNYDGGGT